MAWNRPSEKKVEKRGRGGRWNVRLLIGGAFAAIVVALCVFLIGGDETERPERTAQKTSRIAVKSPAKAVAECPTPRANTKTNAAVRTTGKMDVLAGPEPTPIKKADKPFVPPKTHQTRTFTSGTEQVIGWVFGCEPGDMPMILPPIDPKEKENIVSILISKNEVGKDDTEESAELKQRVDLAKKEMMKYLKEGGDPDEFLKYYHDVLKRAYAWRSEAISQCGELFDEDEGMARDFLNKVNEKFEQEGIKPLDIRQFKPDEGAESTVE